MLTQITFSVKMVIFKKKTKMYEEWYCYTFLQSSLMFGLIESSWILLLASEFNTF